MANQTQTAATKAKDASSFPVPIRHDGQHVHDRLNNEISRRAYELYERNGNSHGQDLVNWLEAESQILQRVPEIRESSSWYTVSVPLQGFTSEQVHVTVDATRAVIAAEKTESSTSPADRQASSAQHANDQSAMDATSSQSTGGNRSEATNFSRESVYFQASWPSEVDPATASAYLKNDSLTLTVKRAAAASKSPAE
jgi:HSP20 family molecular chaperone IbpA